MKLLSHWLYQGVFKNKTKWKISIFSIVFRIWCRIFENTEVVSSQNFLVCFPFNHISFICSQFSNWLWFFYNKMAHTKYSLVSRHLLHRLYHYIKLFIQRFKILWFFNSKFYLILNESSFSATAIATADWTGYFW